MLQPGRHSGDSPTCTYACQGLTHRCSPIKCLKVQHSYVTVREMMVRTGGGWPAEKQQARQCLVHSFTKRSWTLSRLLAVLPAQSARNSAAAHEDVSSQWPLLY